MSRKAAPWFRTGRGWHATVGGRKVPLGVKDPNDRSAAEAAFRRLAGAAEPRAAPADPAARALGLVRELLAVLPAVPGLDNRDRRETSLRVLLIDLDVLAD